MSYVILEKIQNGLALLVAKYSKESTDSKLLEVLLLFLKSLLVVQAQPPPGMRMEL